MLEPKTLPERNDDIPDFKYGDVKEAIVAAAVIVDDIKVSARVFSRVCG